MLGELLTLAVQVVAAETEGETEKESISERQRREEEEEEVGTLRALIHEEGGWEETARSPRDLAATIYFSGRFLLLVALRLVSYLE